MRQLNAKRVLLVDLNNFARYPTIPVGLLAAVLRKSGFEVHVFSPLAIGVEGLTREPRAPWWGRSRERLRHWSAQSRSPVVGHVRARLKARHGSKLAARTSELVTAFTQRLKTITPDAVLISTYLMYLPACTAIAALCKASNVPLMIGGPYFSHPEVRGDWLAIDGLSGLVGGEVEQYLPEVIDDLTSGRDITRFPGVFCRGSDGAERGRLARPLSDLDKLPFPDYADFPWDRYPNRIIPVITGRGCAWGACTFCSDVTSSAGRTFRSRSPLHVLSELEFQSRRHDARLFTFVDLKLNSDLTVWRSIIGRIQHEVPGAEWIGTVHVGSRQPNGLSNDELQAAAASGMRRISTGLESGSQRILDAMRKGTNLAESSRFLNAACRAGISVRVTMMVGYPGEEAGDLLDTAEFLEKHANVLERVSLNRFQIITGSRFHASLERRPDRYTTLTNITVNHRAASIDHHYAVADSRLYRRALDRVVEVTHRINCKLLSGGAAQFEGVM